MRKQFENIKSIKELIKEEHKLVEKFRANVEELEYETDFCNNNIESLTEPLEKVNVKIREINAKRAEICGSFNGLPIEEITIDEWKNMNKWLSFND